MLMGERGELCESYQAGTSYRSMRMSVLGNPLRYGDLRAPLLIQAYKVVLATIRGPPMALANDALFAYQSSPRPMTFLSFLFF